jgi:Pleckstrin homology domain/Sec7 domain
VNATRTTDLRLLVSSLSLEIFVFVLCDNNLSPPILDVVHTICYSLLLLNTDLHLADIDQKMTRNQFVRNTLPTINRVAYDAAPDGFETIRASGKPRPQLNTASRSPTIPSAEFTLSVPEGDSKAKRGSIIVDGSASYLPLVNTPFQGTIKAWEAQVEIVLKVFYNSIQKQRLPLYNAPSEPEGLAPPTTATGNILRRSPSVLSKAGSDVLPRGRSADSRMTTGRWSSKPRSRARLYPASTMGSSRTSLDDQSSVWSPSASSTWSKYSLGKTMTSMSVDSLGSEYHRGGGYQQSIGFANALSHAIIREDSAHSISSFEDPNTANPVLEDETLELMGAPWAKEGSLKHKQHLEAVDKKAKDRNWNECFAVIQRGWLRLFSFNATTKSMRLKSKQRQAGGGGVVVGGGNWMENAEEVWKFLLRQTIASALPPPGYSKSRPHVWALSLPTGAVHLFQVGTAEIVREFVTTANYWSARLSKQPLVGGVSNMEYGWSDAVINSALINADYHHRSPPNSSGTASAAAPRPSFQSSIRSSLDQQGSVRAKLPADRVHLSDWTPPQQSMNASSLTEPEQLTALQNYVKMVEDDLQKHNELRPAMLLAFSPRHPNAAKAMSNWERKSSYLLREIVKFRTYIDCLIAANVQKEKIYASRAEDNNDNDTTEDAVVPTESAAEPTAAV